MSDRSVTFKFPIESDPIEAVDSWDSSSIFSRRGDLPPLEDEDPPISGLFEELMKPLSMKIYDNPFSQFLYTHSQPGLQPTSTQAKFRADKGHVNF